MSNISHFKLVLTKPEWHKVWGMCPLKASCTVCVLFVMSACGWMREQTEECSRNAAVLSIAGIKLTKLRWAQRVLSDDITNPCFSHSRPFYFTLWHVYVLFLIFMVIWYGLSHLVNTMYWCIELCSLPSVGTLFPLLMVCEWNKQSACLLEKYLGGALYVLPNLSLLNSTCHTVKVGLGGTLVQWFWCQTEPLCLVSSMVSK